MVKTIMFLVIILVTLLFVASAINTSAEEELKVKGVTVYVISKAPITKINDSSYLNSDFSQAPYRYQYTDNNFIKEIGELRNNVVSKSNFGNCKDCENSGISSYGFKCNCSGVDIHYDGYWLIGEEKIINTENLSNLTDIKNLVWNSINKIRNDLGYNITHNESLPYTPLLIFIHFTEISPAKLSDKETSAEDMYGYSETEVNESYKNQICDFLYEWNRTGMTNCVFRFTSLEFPLSGNKYIYYLRVAEDTKHIEHSDYGKVVFVHVNNDILSYFYFDDLLSSLDYLDYEKETVLLYLKDDINKKGIIYDANNLDKSLSDLRFELIQNTSINLSYTTRKRNLELFRPNLNRIELTRKNISASIDKIEKFYNVLKGKSDYTYNRNTSLFFKEEKCKSVKRTFGRHFRNKADFRKNRPTDR